MISHVWNSGPLSSFSPPQSSGVFADWCVRFVSNIFSSPFSNKLLDLLGSIFWSLWSFRNEIRFRQASWDPGVLAMVIQGWKARCLAAQLIRHPQLTPPAAEDPRSVQSHAWSSASFDLGSGTGLQCVHFV